MPRTRAITEMVNCSVRRMDESLPVPLNPEAPLITLTGLKRLTYSAGYPPDRKPVSPSKRTKKTQNSGYFLKVSSMDIYDQRLLYAGTSHCARAMATIS